MDSGHRETHLRPERSHDKLLPARLLHRLDDRGVSQQLMKVRLIVF